MALELNSAPCCGGGKNMFSISICGHRLMYYSMFMIIVITQIPVTRILPSYIRNPLQIFAVTLFMVALLQLKRYGYLWALISLFLVSSIYYTASWIMRMKTTTYLFNSLCCWEIAVYGILTLRGVVRYEKKIVLLVFFITIITAITTIVGLEQFPMAVRELGRRVSYSGLDVKTLYYSKNIASWGQLYGIVFILGGLIYSFKQTRKKIMLFAIILIEICIVKSQLTFALLISIMLLFLIFTNIKSQKIYYPLIFLAIFLFVLMVGNIKHLVLWSIDLLNQFEFQMLTKKLGDLYTLLIGSIEGDAAVRFRLYTQSLNTFLEYPFGLYWLSNVYLEDYIGFHSEICDIIGALGVLGLFIVILCTSIWLYSILKIRDPYQCRFMVFMFFTFLMLAILNPIFYSPPVWMGALALPAHLVSVNKKL